jgi:CheY-like chemotaxis protein
MRDRPLVLLLDDEEIFLEIATIKLQMNGFGVEVAHSVVEALTRAEELLPDLILSDIYMPPGPSGWDFALAVRSNPKLKDIKFAFFTSLRDPMGELGQGERVRVADLLREIPIFSKTDDVDVLDKRVRGIL